MKKSPLADLNNVSSSPGAVYSILFRFSPVCYILFPPEVGDVSEYAHPLVSGMPNQVLTEKSIIFRKPYQVPLEPRLVCLFPTQRIYFELCEDSI